MAKRHSFHQPVMARETVERLAVRPGGAYVDGTLGEGGHSLAILEACSPTGTVLGIDLDPRSLASAAQRLADFGLRFTPVQGSYARMVDLARATGMAHADGVLMDLGFSSRQVEEPGYGFSFHSSEPLDMRFDPEAPLNAAEIVNKYSEQELARVIYIYGEEPRSRIIARRIVGNRPIESAAELASLIARTLGQQRGRRTHPATRTFQALRIAVNDELGSLPLGLEAAIQLLAPSGWLVVISYHSLEDRVVKTFMNQESAGCICPPEVPVCVCQHIPTLRLISRRVIKPSAQEVQQNPRSRSAKLRVACRL